MVKQPGVNADTKLTMENNLNVAETRIKEFGDDKNDNFKLFMEITKGWDALEKEIRNQISIHSQKARNAENKRDSVRNTIYRRDRDRQERLAQINAVDEDEVFIDPVDMAIAGFAMSNAIEEIVEESAFIVEEDTVYNNNDVQYEESVNEPAYEEDRRDYEEDNYSSNDSSNEE